MEEGHALSSGKPSRSPNRGTQAAYPSQAGRALHLSLLWGQKEFHLLCLGHPVLYRSDLLFSLNYPMFQKLGLQRPSDLFQARNL